MEAAPGGFEIVAGLIVLAASFSWLNHRFLGLPTTIGLMAFGLGFSLLLLLASRVEPGVERVALDWLTRIDFDYTLLHGMLGFLLFAGALHVDLDDLVAQGRVIALLASVGLIVSTLLVGLGVHAAAALVGLDVGIGFCLLFGALISPTDPIAVLSILKTMRVPRSLEVKIAGESLFNDGVAVVIFLAILAAIGTGSEGAAAAGPLWLQIARLFLVEAVGGAAFGFIAGYLAYRAICSVDQYEVEILVSLALVAGGYSLAMLLHVSGPIAMVIAGLIIGNQGRRFAMSRTTREHLDTFWKLVDEVLNALLFVLIGLEVLVLSFEPRWLAAGLLAIPIVLAARLVGVGLPILALRRLRAFTPHAVKVLTWGGLRGGISVALALSLASVLPASDRPVYEGLLVMTYIVVCFSILVQGSSFGPLLRRWRVVTDAGASPGR